MPDSSRSVPVDAAKSRPGRLGALAQQAQYDTRVTTDAARRAAWQRFEVIVDPDGALPPAERERRAAALRKAHFVRMGLASGRARRRAA